MRNVREYKSPRGFHFYTDLKHWLSTLDWWEIAAWNFKHEIFIHIYTYLYIFIHTFIHIYTYIYTYLYTNFKHEIFIHKIHTYLTDNYSVMSWPENILTYKNFLMNFRIFDIEKKVLCNYRQSNYVIAVQLTQDLSRSWMVVHAKFQKIS